MSYDIAIVRSDIPDDIASMVSCDWQDRGVDYVDMDSFQTYDDYIPPFEAGDILETADLLHKPVKNVFEDLITERLREEVLRHE